MKSLVLFSLVICLAVMPLRAKPSFRRKPVNLFKKTVGQWEYEKCRCDRRDDGNQVYGEKYSVKMRSKRSYDSGPQEARMRRKRCRCDGQDNDNGSVISSPKRFADTIPDPDDEMNPGKKRRLHGGEGHQTSLQKLIKRTGGGGQGMENPCRGIPHLLPGAIPLEMLDDLLQSVDANRDGALDEAELTLFFMAMELLRLCNN